VVGGFVTDDAAVDPAVAGCAELVLGEVECLLRAGGRSDDLSPGLFAGIEWRELRHVLEDVAADVDDLAQVQRDVIFCGLSAAQRITCSLP
jgi:hypothetical protein